MVTCDVTSGHVTCDVTSGHVTCDVTSGVAPAPQMLSGSCLYTTIVRAEVLSVVFLYVSLFVPVASFRFTILWTM